MNYRPGHSRIGEPTPQTDPDLFTDDELNAEILYLVALDRRYGEHILRAMARARLFAELVHRRAVTARQKGE